jgi:hypothetical protein
MVCDEPWKTKECLIRTVSLLLNLDQNRHHLFHSKLSEVRREAKARARELPIAHRQNAGPVTILTNAVDQARKRK